MYKAKLSIQEVNWSGFTAKKGEPITSPKNPYFVEVLPKQKVLFGFAGRKYTIKILDISESSVQVYTETLSIKNPGGGISLRPEPTKITIQAKEMKVFYTPTTDMGARWEVTLVSTEKMGQDRVDSLSKEGSGGMANAKIRTPKVYFSETQRILSRLEEKLETKIILYYVPKKYVIDQEHADYFLEQLKDVGHRKKLSLIVFSTGGDSMGCLRIATLLRSFCETLEILVPSTCSSAATQLALSADKILFTPLGYLSPIDTQLLVKEPHLTDYSYNQISISSFLKARDFLEKEGPVKSVGEEAEGAYRTLFKYVHPIVYAEAERLSKRSKMTAKIMMNLHQQSFENQKKIDSIANNLVFDYPDHGFPIQYEKAKEVGLPAEKLPDDVSYLLWDLLKFYKGATREVTTFVHLGSYHVEETPVVIESVNKRVIKRYSFNQQYSSVVKKWQTTNDNTQWVKLTPSNSLSTPYITTPIEVEETMEYKTLTEKVGDETFPKRENNNKSRQTF